MGFEKKKKLLRKQVGSKISKHSKKIFSYLNGLLQKTGNTCKRCKQEIKQNSDQMRKNNKKIYIMH